MACIISKLTFQILATFIVNGKPLFIVGGISLKRMGRSSGNLRQEGIANTLLKDVLGSEISCACAPIAYLDEVKREFDLKWNIGISISTVHTILQEFGITLKVSE